MLIPNALTVLLILASHLSEVNASHHGNSGLTYKDHVGRAGRECDIWKTFSTTTTRTRTTTVTSTSFVTSTVRTKVTSTICTSTLLITSGVAAIPQATTVTVTQSLLSNAAATVDITQIVLSTVTSTILSTVPASTITQTSLSNITVFQTSITTAISTSISTMNASTITTTFTKTVAPLPTAIDNSGCPAVNNDTFAAEYNTYEIECASTYLLNNPSTPDILNGGAPSSSVYSCAQVCDTLSRGGVACAAGVYNSFIGRCYPFAPGGNVATSSMQFETAVKITVLGKVRRVLG